jgi:alcohol dehydrogenase
MARVQIPFPVQIQFYKALLFGQKVAATLQGQHVVRKVMNFPSQTLFSGPGSSRELLEYIATAGHKHLLVVTDAALVKLGLVAPLLEKLTQLGVRPIVYDGVQPDPTIAQIEAGLTILQREGCSAVLAFGGGSSLDAAKVIAARASNAYPVKRMAGIMRVLHKPLPLYAVPTTAGTGSEVTIAAVVSDPDATRKFSVIDPKLLPLGAALDAELMAGLPRTLTAATGMDALTHAVEAFISRNHTLQTDAQAIDAVALIVNNLPRAFRDGSDLVARQNMALASYKAGAAFTAAGVGYVHAIAHNLGAYYHLPHGYANAIVLPRVLEFSKPAAAARLARLGEIAGLRKGPATDEQLADAFIAHVRALNAEFGIPSYVDALQVEHIPEIAEKAAGEAHWTYAVPRYMDTPELEVFVRQMLPPLRAKAAAVAVA